MKTIKPFFTREQLDEIIYQYTKLNKSAFSLEKMFNCCAGTIIKNLKLEGIKLRTQKESTTKYSLNENFFNEFTIEFSKNAHEVNQKLLAKNIIGGYCVDNKMILAFTELTTEEDIKNLAKNLGEILG